MRLSIIVAMDTNQLIGKDNALPWHLPQDLAYFKKTTIGKTVLMGRKTYQSIGFALPDRRNIVISHNADFKAQGCEVVASIDDALTLTKNDNEVMIMGGASFYKQMLPIVDRLYITQIENEFEGDTYFPAFNQDDFVETFRETHLVNKKTPYTYHFIILDSKILK